MSHEGTCATAIAVSGVCVQAFADGIRVQPFSAVQTCLAGARLVSRTKEDGCVQGRIARIHAAKDTSQPKTLRSWTLEILRTDALASDLQINYGGRLPWLQLQQKSLVRGRTLTPKLKSSSAGFCGKENKVSSLKQQSRPHCKMQYKQPSLLLQWLLSGLSWQSSVLSETIRKPVYRSSLLR